MQNFSIYMPILCVWYACVSVCDSQPNLKCNILICRFAEAIDLALDGATEARMDVLECDSDAFFFLIKKVFYMPCNSMRAFLRRSGAPC